MLSKKIRTYSPKVIACIQARMGSERLKSKALLLINGKTIIEIIYERLKKCKEIDDIILSTSDTKENDILAEHAKKINLKCHRGPENDLILRHLGALRKTGGHALLKITADCPLIDPDLADKMVAFFKKNHKNYDFFTNCLPPTYPDGLDLDITPLHILEKLDREIDKKSPHRDFFIAYIMSNPSRFKIYNTKNKTNLSSMRWTLDYPEDYDFLQTIFRALKEKEIFGMEDVLRIVSEKPDISEINRERIDNVISNNIRSAAYHSAVKKEKKFIILDFDGTIVDLNVNWQSVKDKISKLFSPYNIILEKEKPLFDRIKSAAKKAGLYKKEKKAESVFYRKCLKIIEKEELSAIQKAKPVTGAKDFLRWLYDERWQFAVLSNNNSTVIKKVFKKLSLSAPKIILGFDDVENQKPDIEGIKKIMEETKKGANECLLIGDSLADVEIGRTAGVKTYILKRDNKKNNTQNFFADFIKDFNQLKEILKNG